jgi:two-component system sensor histidine kinase KdpD
MDTDRAPSPSLGEASGAETPAAAEPRSDRTPGRGRLRVYLGAAPGSGKTFAMLREGRERVARGEDTVVGWVETYGRPRTVEAIGRLEVVPRLRVHYRGAVLEEMDLDAVLERRPHVALIDELAHTNAPGVRHRKRWQDVELLRDAGVDVVTTLNVQHIESVKDLVEHIAGVPVRETVPDQIVDGADEIQFIDIAPEALRKRMRHGNIYAPEKVDTALRNFFRPGNLAALREISLRLVAQSVEASRAEVRPVPQDVLVAISGRASSERLIRRGVRLARRRGGLCLVLNVVRPGGVPAGEAERWGRFAEQLHCSFLERRADSIATAVIETAREIGVRHVVVGESQSAPPLWRWRRSLLDRLVDELPGVDVHVIARLHRASPGAAAAPAERPRGDRSARSPEPVRRRGMLRVYVGYARGCGTTTAMLEEGRRRRSRGTDVVVAAVDTAGRPESEGALAGLEMLGGRRGTAARNRLNVAALLRRDPDVACIDDLAGLASTGRTRAEVVAEVLDAGITVIATVHVADIRSTAEAMAAVLGRPADRPQVDDAVLDVDVVPATLDERLRRGAIVPPAEAARALQGEFRPQVLAALREVAFRLTAQHTDRQLVAYMRERRIDRPWEARSRVMACVPPRPSMHSLIRRAARLADSTDGELRVVTVRTRPRSGAEKEQLGEYASLTHQLGGEFVTLYESARAPALAAYATTTLATEILLARGRGGGHWSRGTLRQLIRTLTDVDIHIMAAEEA